MRVGGAVYLSVPTGSPKASFEYNSGLPPVCRCPVYAVYLFMLLCCLFLPGAANRALLYSSEALLYSSEAQVAEGAGAEGAGAARSAADARRVQADAKAAAMAAKGEGSKQKTAAAYLALRKKQQAAQAYKAAQARRNE